MQLQPAGGTAFIFLTKIRKNIFIFSLIRLFL